MTNIQPLRMTAQDYTRLHDELARLRPRASAGDAARQARIGQIEGLLSNVVVVGEAAAFDPVAEAGMVLTIRYDDTGETETFLLGRPGSEGADLRAYSMASPLGRVIAGARPGDQRLYAHPDETGRFVTLLKAMPYEMYVAKSTGARAVCRGRATVRAARRRPCAPARAYSR